MDGFAAENASEVRLLSVRRRTEGVHRGVICNDGGHAAACRYHIALSPYACARADGLSVAVNYLAASEWNQNGCVETSELRRECKSKRAHGVDVREKDSRLSELFVCSENCLILLKSVFRQ